MREFRTVRACLAHTEVLASKDTVVVHVDV